MTDSDGTINITVDGRAVEAKKGEMIIAAAERAGVYIPRFCYHPRMRPVGMCRMCMVEVVGPRGPQLQPACYVPVADGQEVITESDAVRRVQDGVLELLLVNHPLDCPVCDKGGECPLQDQAFAFGPGETRFVEEKRHWAKPIPLSDLVYLDRERCIQCDRCTRFADEVAGDPLIEFVGRGGHTEVNTFPDQPFSSYFSGNTVQICPVGALTSTAYRFKARPWDLEQVESTCQTCAVGCRFAVQSSQDKLTRYIGLDSDPVNHGWLCDKGRFSFESVNSDQRIAHPLVRKGDELVEASWGEALDAAAAGIGDAKTGFGPESVAVLGGARLANEDAYVWARLAKGVLGTDNVDCQLGDGLPAHVVLGLPRATIDEACSAGTVVLLGPDIKEELPVLYLRLRSAAVDGDTKLVELTSQATGLTRYADRSIFHAPGEAAAAARELLEGGALEGPVVVVLGRPSVAESPQSIVDAASVLAAGGGEVKFLSALRRGNVHGALDMGLAPGLLPGRVTLEDGRQYWNECWGGAPAEAGLDAIRILQKAADGDLHGLVLLGADVLEDFPDHDLARRALDRAGFVVAVDSFLTETAKKADVVLPVAMFGERAGTTTNIEGRVTRLGQKITPPGVAWPDWMIAVELAARWGHDLDYGDLNGIWDEIERRSPAHAGVTRVALSSRQYRDGVVVPLAGGQLPDPAADDRQLDRTAAAGLDEVEEQGETAEPPQDHELEADTRSNSGDEPPVADDGPDKPAMVTFTPSTDHAPAPARDNYSLRLVTGRKLYDRGVHLTHSPSLASLAAKPVLTVHPSDLDRLGVKSGGQVRLRSARLTTTIEVLADERIPRGAAALPFNLHDIDAGTLIDVTKPVTDVAIETVS